MSVMLRSTNPEAVNEIDPTRDHRRPYQGQQVLFHARPGEARMGKATANAEVLSVEDDDHVELLIKYAADDAIVRWKIPRRTEQNPYNSWSFNEHDDAHYQRNGHAPAAPKPEGHLNWDDVKEMHAEIGALRNRVSALEGELIALKARKKPGPKPKSETEGETEGAEIASELEPRDV